MADPREPFRVAAFDLDGTLIDTMPDLTAAVNLMLGMLAAPQLPQAKVRTLVGGGVEMLVQRALAESLGAATAHAAQRSAALTLFDRFYSQALFKQSTVYPGVERALHALEEAGVKLCCVTNKSSRFALPLLELAGLRKRFLFTLCADRVEDRKPSPTLLLAACSRLSIAPGQMLYVGDSTVDIAAARAAGSGIVAVSYGYDTPGRLERARPDGLVDTLADLTTLRLRSAVPGTQLRWDVPGAATA